MIRLTTQQVKMLHRDVIAQSGGSPEIRDGCTGLVRSSCFFVRGIPVGTRHAVSLQKRTIFDPPQFPDEFLFPSLQICRIML